MTNFPKIYVAGHRGMVGSAIVRQLLAQGHPAERIVSRTHAELDLCNQAAVNAFFEQEKPDQVYMAAAKVGGIHANNTYPAEFIYDNLMVQANVIHVAFQNGVKKLKQICTYFGLSPLWCISSELKKDISLRAQCKILAICEELGATHYINVPGGKELYDRQSFESKGLELSFIQPLPKKYSQFGKDFLPHLSIIDVMMFNYGDEEPER